LCVPGQSSFGSVLVDATTYTNLSAASSVSFSHPTGNLGNRGLVVAVSMQAGSGNTVQNVTYGGQALLPVVAQNRGSVRVELWGMLNPPTGAATVTVTLASSSTGAVVGATTFAGVDQNSPLADTTSNSGTSANPNTAVNSSATQLVFAAVAFQNTSPLTPAANQTQQWSALDNANVLRGAASTATGAGLTMSWTQPSGTSAQWAVAAIAISAAPSADVSAAMSGAATAVPLGNILYTIAVTNQGPFTATNVVVTDALPAGATFVSASAGGALSGGVVTWNLGSMAANAKTNLTLTLKAPNVAGLVTNKVSSSSTTLDLAPSNNNGTAAAAMVVTIVNTLPVPASPTVTRWPLGNVKLRAANLLGTDADGDALSLTFASAATAQGGAISTNSVWVYYTRPSGFTNADSFAYTVNDPRGGSVSGIVNIALTADESSGANYVLTDLGNGAVQLNFSAIPGRNYVIQFSPTSGAPAWSPLITSTADALGAFTIVDASAGGPTGRVYRALESVP
jgi:uncharacterized repeat protein (TIGR01451 family)